MAFPYTQTFTDGTPYPVVPSGTAVVNVSTQAGLDAAIAALAPGQKIVLASGAYTSLTVTGKNGTATAGVSIVAATAGGPKFTGGATIKDCSYLTVSGLSWPQDTGGDTFQFRGASHHCRMIRCTIGPPTHPGTAITTEAGNYVYVGDDCHDLDIGYNELRNKARAGNGVRVYGNFTTYVGCARVRIHHNNIHDFYPAAVNDFEPIRYGVSTMSRTDAYGVVERNVLTNIRSEPELISGKMGALRITGNVAKTCSGSFVIRHGRNCVLADNYAVDGADTTNTNGEKSGGFRFYDSGHLIERNYGGGLTGTNFQDPLILDTGDVEGTSTNLAGHWRVVGATVAGNVLVNCPSGVAIGNNYTLAPLSCTVKGNAALAVTSGSAITQRVAPVSSTLDGTNVYFSTPAGGGWVADADGIWRKDGYGPRLTYLSQAGVGPGADLTEADGTGVVLTGASTVTPGTGTTTGGTTGVNPGSTGGTVTPAAAPVRTLGVNGIPRPTAGPGVTLINTDSTSALNISTSGTSAQPRIYDGGGHTIGRITINADWVIVQNFRVVANGQYGIYSTGSHVTIANNDISAIHGPGDLNAITMFGDYHHIIYNTAIDFISGDPGDSHTDFIQCWDTASKRPSSNVVIQGNKASTPSKSITNRVIHQCIMAEGPASTDGGGGGPGPMSNWLVADNYFKGSWNQEIKFDDIDNVTVTRNTFAGDATKICEVTSLSSGFKFFADNKITGSYPSGVGTSTTAGNGPLGPYPPGSTVPGTGTGGTGGGTNSPPGTVSVDAGPDNSVPGGGSVTLTATETNSTALTVTSRKWEVVGVPGAGGTVADPSEAASRLGWGTPLPSSDEFNYSGSVDAAKWSPSVGAAGGGTFSAARGTVNGTKLVASGLVDGSSFMLSHRFGQQYGRWETRLRHFSTGTTVGGGTGQTLGVGGIAKPAAASNVELNNANRGDMNISTSGTALVPRIYDGGGFTCGKIVISASYIIIQNYNINANSNYGVYITGSHVTVQNCDVKNVHAPGDLNIFTLLKGSDIKIAYNTCVNTITGDPGDSHTDFIQTWVSASNTPSVNDVQVIGNKVIGPANPSRNNAIPSIHQIIMVESAGRGGNSGGTGTPSNWMVADNEFSDSWGQAIKLDAGNNFTFTRNKFTGSSDVVFNIVAGTGNKVYSDNTFGTGYGSTGTSIIAGPGPGTPGGGGTAPGNYNPIVCVTPDSGHNVEDGAYYIATNTTPGEGTERAQMYFPRDPSANPGYREFTRAVDWTQFHNLALEWTPTALTGYLDGVQFFTTGGGATAANRNITTMPSGHLLLGLNVPGAAAMNPGTMEVDWVRVYSLTPQGTAGGAGTGQIGTAQSVTWTAPLTVGAYLLRYTATLSDGTTRFDDVTVTVQTATPGYFFPPGVASEETFGASTAFFSGTARPSSLLYPGTTTFPGATTFPGFIPGGVDTPGAVPGTFIPPGIPSEEAFGVTNNFYAGIPKLFFVPDGIPGEETFGATTTFTAGSEPAPAVGGVFVPSLWAVDKITGEMIPLPKWQKITLSRVRHALGTITVDYPQDAPGFTTLAASVQAAPPKALEIRVWLGGNSTGSVGGWLVSKQVGNKLTPGGVWQFSGHFHEWLLTKAVVAPQEKTALNPNGELIFAGDTYGAVLLTVIQQAQLRRALPLVVCDFTASKDSNGAPWSQVVTNLRLPPKTSIIQVADKGVDLGMIEYYMTGSRVLRAFNSGTRGVDRSVTVPPLVFQQTANLTEHSQRESSRDAGTAVLAAGGEGFYAWGTDPTAEASLGFRAEVGADGGGNITSQVSVNAYAQVQAQIAAKGVAEYTSGIAFRPGDPLPLLNYDVGDVAVAVTGVDRTPSRIEQLDVTFEPGNAPSGTVAQNGLVVDKLAALYRKINALQAGDAVVGTSTATPGGAGDDTTPPAAPTGVVIASNIAYQNPGDVTVFAVVTVGWLPVTTNAGRRDLPIVRAAQFIADRFASGLEIFEDWTWVGMPQVVGEQNEALLTLFEAATPTAGNWPDPRKTESKTWLDGYLAANQGTGAATDDVDHYRVQYRYVGPTQVGLGSKVLGDPDLDPSANGSASQITDSGLQPGPTEAQAFRDPNYNGPGLTSPDFGWADAPGSPTKETQLTFGDVTGSRYVGVRVAAVDTSGNQSAWSVELDFLSASDNTPPPVASKPMVSAYFRTMNVTWDGKGSEGEDLIVAAPDFLSGGGLEVHVAQGFNFEPHRPTTPDGKLDLGSSTTYQAQLYGAGTWNVSGLSIGITYYARFVAVDNNGNASDPSATSDGVKISQLVNIDIGPNAIAREQIIDGEIVRAKIGNAEINSAKVEEISAGLISAGTIQSQIAIAGRFYTPTTANGNRVEFDAAGIRLYRGGTIVGRWQVADASVLVTGQSQTAVTGSRLVMNPGGSQPDTMLFYPSFSNVFSSIDSVDWNNGQVAGIRVIGSGGTATSNAGMLLIRDQFASMVHGRKDLTYWGSEIWVEQAFTRNKSAAVDLIIDERLTPVSGPRRVAMIHYDAAGNPINATGWYYKKTDFNGGEPQLYANGQDVATVYGGGRLVVINNPNVDFRPVLASAFTVSSSREVKRDIATFADAGIDPVEHLRGRHPRRFRRKDDPDVRPHRLGFIAEEMPHEVRDTAVMKRSDGGPDRVVESLDYASVTALLWAATQRIDARLSALEDGMKNRETTDG